MTLNPDEAAEVLKTRFAAAGFGPADVRVAPDPTSLGSTIDVTILRLGVRLDAIDAIVSEYLEPLFDDRNELLLGWNRHVDVRYAREALAPLHKMALHRIRGIKVGQGDTVGPCIVEHTDNAVGWEVELKLVPDFTPRAFATASRAANFIAQVVAASGGTSIP